MGRFGYLNVLSTTTETYATAQYYLVYTPAVSGDPSEV